MSKFKVGDLVRFVLVDGRMSTVSTPEKYECEITAVLGGDRYRVRFPNIPGSTGKPFETEYHSRHLRLREAPVVASVPGAKKTWIISVIIDGQFAPSQRPAEYVSAAQARAVARSMAEKNPGQTFVVLEAVGAAYVPPAPTAGFVTL